VATMLDNGLALDGLDEHDARAVVAGLCTDLVAADPGAAVRARARATADSPGDLHDPEAASAAYQMAATIVQLIVGRRAAPRPSAYPQLVPLTLEVFTPGCEGHPRPRL
jgi:hypothetical protein